MGRSLAERLGLSNDVDIDRFQELRSKGEPPEMEWEEFHDWYAKRANSPAVEDTDARR